jgi:hypothetical protein
MSIAILEECIETVTAVAEHMDEASSEQLPLLVKDLEDAMMTIFVKTAEARPLLERCQAASLAIKEAVETEDGWGESARKAFGKFDKAVSKLRSTIMVRAQRAT